VPKRGRDLVPDKRSPLSALKRRVELNVDWTHDNITSERSLSINNGNDTDN